MKKFVTVLGFVIISFFGFHQQVFAQEQPGLITPTVYCLGSCPTVPPEPNTEVPLSPTLPGSSPAPTSGNTSPSTIPQPSIDPCQAGQTSTLHGGKKKKKRDRDNRDGGFFQQFFEFLFRLIEELLRRLGIELPDSGTPDDNSGPGNGDDDDDSDDDNSGPDNGDDDSEPCPEPSGDAQPSDDPEPSEDAEPSDDPQPSTGTQPSPTIFNQPTTPPTSGTVPVGNTEVFVGNYDTGDFSQWGTCQWKGFNSGCGGYNGQDYMVQLVNDGAGHETAARFEVRSGDEPDFGGERAEVRAGGAADVSDGDERWYEFSLKFPEDFSNPQPWFIVMQWHAGDGSPPLALQVTNDGVLEFSNNRTSASTEIGAIQRGSWVDYVLHVRFSGGSDALAEAWVNGVKQPGVHSEPNMASGSNYLKMGIYRGDQSATHVVLHDGLRITAP